MGTKALSAENLRSIMGRLGFVFLEGDSELTLKAALSPLDSVNTNSSLHGAEMAENRVLNSSLCSRALVLNRAMSRPKGQMW